MSSQRSIIDQLTGVWCKIWLQDIIADIGSGNITLTQININAC